MTGRLAATLAALMFFGFLLGNEAYAKGPIYNEGYTFAQSMWLIIMPAIVAGVILVMIAFYARQNQQIAMQ
jgi:ABC-type dipeptide/oligopeptide/nickel transport system permease subunit